MPLKTKKKGKRAKVKAVDTSALKKFLKRYENHCAQCQSAVSPSITRALKKCIQDGSEYLKIILSGPEMLLDTSSPVLLRPLLMTIRDERYMLATDLYLWGVPLSNQDVASLAILLELKGRTSYPFVKLEAIACGIDLWSVERLGKAVRYSQLTSITLDHNEFRDEGLEGLIRGLEGNMKMVSLSLCYCNLGPPSGTVLGKLLAESAISELYLTGNYLQCSGAVDLITSIAEKVQELTTEKPTEEATSLAHQILEAQDQSGIHTMMSGPPTPAISPAITPAISPDRGSEKGKRKKKGRKKKDKPIALPGPWVRKLFLANNGIDARGIEGETGVLEFSQLLSSLIRYSEQLSELDIDDNCLGELPATDILEALMERNQRKLPRLKIKVTAQISPVTFKSILKQSGKLKTSKKKRRRKKK
ncbi:hypothetical protein GDO81_007302 [Engystomops pustulosus]|uniref:Uncharacterized protein n=2 Tax=Engystomops pustulosus TaxID=76066 RepID=A0AAV7C602_ENGPU|nr:hypothetical protein GDO81_007302 [Engystomops pustulosus]KAG8580429.1 hypothetical protein GDO81_007302 [Engystomops pustulosus]